MGQEATLTRQRAIRRQIATNEYTLATFLKSSCPGLSIQWCQPERRTSKHNMFGEEGPTRSIYLPCT